MLLIDVERNLVFWLSLVFWDFNFAHFESLVDKSGLFVNFLPFDVDFEVVANVLPEFCNSYSGHSPNSDVVLDPLVFEVEAVDNLVDFVLKFDGVALQQLEDDENDEVDVDEDNQDERQELQVHKLVLVSQNCQDYREPADHRRNHVQRVHGLLTVGPIGGRHDPVDLNKQENEQPLRLDVRLVEVQEDDDHHLLRHFDELPEVRVRLVL